MSETTFQQLETQTLRSNVIHVLRQAILNGDLQPGDAINQADVAKRLGISRGPLREALGLLEEEGLVRILPYKGAYVTELSAVFIEELYSLRGVLEEFAVRRAVDRASADEIQRLDRVVADMRDAATAGDDYRLGVLDLEFHRGICLMAQHSLLMQQWKAIENGVHRCLSLRHSIYDDLFEIVGSHPDIVAAIAARNAEHAVRLLRRHILDAGETLVRAWTVENAAAAAD